jgi:hypothetical protein
LAHKLEYLGKFETIFKAALWLDSKALVGLMHKKHEPRYLLLKIFLKISGSAQAIK